VGAAKRIFLLAGEPSGDMLGGRLMQALRAQAPALELVGVGGPRMVAQGLETLFSMDELSLIGFTEILPHLPRLMRRLRETVAAIDRLHPDMVLTIDSPGFSLRLQRRLAGRKLIRAHYVAPQVWAWRAERARHLTRDLDHLLALLPFEPPFFERYGLACTFVGHPIIEEAGCRGDGAAFRAAHRIDPDHVLLCLLPGSRGSEIRRHLPVLSAAVRLLERRFPALRTVLPTLPARLDEVRKLTSSWQPLPLVVVDPAARFDAYAASRAAIAASGTISLEVALAGLPFVTIYRTGPLTAWLARRLIKVPYVNLANLILDRPAVPELLQAECRPDRIAVAVAALLEDETARAAQRQALAEVGRRLGGGGEPAPSARAAALVLDLLHQHQQGRAP
jgi:lipid-A-disaccharide synthase